MTNNTLGTYHPLCKNKKNKGFALKNKGLKTRGLPLTVDNSEEKKSASLVLIILFTSISRSLGELKRNF